MTELQRLLAAYDQHRAAGRACALATVVEVLGSAYRRPGARMLVTDDGQLTGAISGGCLEGDARRRAQQAIHRGQPALVTYDSTDEDDAQHGVGLGLGCRGIVRILLEPLDFNDNRNVLEMLRLCLQERREVVLATAFSLADGGGRVRVGERQLFTAHGPAPEPLAMAPELSAQLVADARQVLESGQSATLDYATATGPVRVFLEMLRPSVRLTVFGAGNDAQPLVQLAAALGWEVTVVDGRPALATAARFPQAAAVQVTPVQQLAFPADYDSLAVLLTHNYTYDLAVLRQLLPTATPYIGLLGPRKKAERILAELRAAGLAPDDQLRGRLYAPIGLNIGAETAEEIALSIVAEIQAVLAQRPAGFLRDAPGPIHERAALPQFESAGL